MSRFTDTLDYLKWQLKRLIGGKVETMEELEVTEESAGQAIEEFSEVCE